MSLLAPLANLTKAQLEAQVAELQQQLEALAAAQAQAPAQALPVNNQRLVGLLKAAKTIHRPGQPTCASALLVNSTPRREREDGTVIPAIELPFDAVIANGELGDQLLELSQLAWARIAVTGYWRPNRVETYTGRDGRTYSRATGRQLEVLSIEVLGSGQPKEAPASQAVQPTLEPINF